MDEYRKWKQIHVEVDNYALEGIPEEKILAHVCWGSWSAPHMYSVHEWRVWREVKIPDGKIFMPGPDIFWLRPEYGTTDVDGRQPRPLGLSDV